MGEKELKGYLDLIKIKTINSYYKYIATFLILIYTLITLSLGIPIEFYKLYASQIDSLIILISSSTSIIGFIKKYKKNKQEFIENNDIKFETSVKECYDILKKEEIIKNNAPNNKIDRYYIDPGMYMTSKGKKLIRKR